jgi:hypothetical protein
MAIVPAVVGATIDQAVNQLSAANLGVGTTTVGPDSRIPPGRIAKVEPAVGAGVADKSLVSLTISGGPPSVRQIVADNAQPIFFNIVAAGLLIFFAVQIGASPNPLATLADKDTARGLITFLISATAVALFVIMTVSTVVYSKGADDDKRFDRGKQVLTMLIGILGTIVGYYFGADVTARSSPAGTTGQTQAQAPKIGDVKVSNLEPKKNEISTISATISGGKPPYKYSIILTPPLGIPPIVDKPSADGKINEQITIPASLTANTDVEYRIDAVDGEGTKASVTGTKKISVKTGP